MNKKIVMIDVDDTVAELVPTWIEIHNKKYGENVKPEDILDWNIGKYFKNDIYETLRDRSLYDFVKPVENSRLGISFIRSCGYRIIFVTSSPIEQSGRKFTWLNDNGFDVKDKDYFEARDKSVFDVGVVIDDNYENVFKQENRGAVGIIFTKSWNKIYKMNKRVGSWKELINLWRNKFEFNN